VSPALQAPQYLVDTHVVSRPPIRSTSLISNAQEQRFSLQVSQPAAEWIQSAIAKIEGLTTLAPGWDGYSGKMIDSTVAVQAVKFVIDHAYPTLPEPAIVPTAEGGIQIEWHRGGIDFEVAISDVESTVFVEDTETGNIDERPADQANSIFGDVIGRLAASA
jgi:hypothetical protein